MTTLSDLDIPVLMRKSQVEQMIQSSLPVPLTVWNFRTFTEGRNKDYFLKPTAFYILKKKRNSLYNREDVQDFIKWYLLNIEKKVK